MTDSNANSNSNANFSCRSGHACPDGKSCGVFVEPNDPVTDVLRPCGRCQNGKYNQCCCFVAISSLTFDRSTYTHLKFSSLINYFRCKFRATFFILSLSKISPTGWCDHITTITSSPAPILVSFLNKVHRPYCPSDSSTARLLPRNK